MEYVLGILGLGAACALWVIIQLWTGKGSKGNNRWRGGGGCKPHILLASCCLLLSGCSEEPEMLAQSAENIMGTPIVVFAPSDGRASEIVFNSFHHVDDAMSEWKPNSPLTSVNNAAGISEVHVPSEVVEALQRALAVADLTSGAFDPTWAALWSIWKFDGSNRVPTDKDISEKLSLVDWRAVELDVEKNTVFLPDMGMMLGLGGIAKGIALDVARDALTAIGINDFMIVAGGQVLVQGLKEGRPWRIGIRDPDGPPKKFLAVLSLTDTCVSTSGDYEKFFIVDGKRYHHIIDPRTGFPATGTRSVTVITPDATLADALSTALFVMGPNSAMQLVNTLDAVEAVIINTEGRILLSENISNRLKIMDSSGP